MSRISFTTSSIDDDVFLLCFFGPGFCEGDVELRLFCGLENQVRVSDCWDDPCPGDLGGGDRSSVISAKNKRLRKTLIYV